MVGSGRRRPALGIAVACMVAATAFTLLSATGAAPWLVAVATTASGVVAIVGEWALVRVLDAKAGQPEASGRGRGQVVAGEIPRTCPAFQRRRTLTRLLPTRGGGARKAVATRVLVGAPGSGKSQLAADLTRRCIAAGWPVVAWLNAESGNQLIAGWDRLAAELGIGDDEADRANAARSRLEQLDRPSLLVFDNAGDVEILTALAPRYGRTRVVVTSTSHHFDDLGKPVPVGAFTPKEALSFLEERTGLADREGALTLADELDRLPLALSQAAAVIRSQRLSYQTYRERLHRIDIAEYLTPFTGDPYPRGVAQAVALSLEAAESECPADGLTQPLLWLLSVLSSAGVARQVVHAAAHKLIPSVDELEAVASADAVLGALATACLLTISEDGEIVVMHRLVARITRERAIRQGHLDTMVLVAGQTLKALLPNDPTQLPDRVWGDHLADQIEATHEALGGQALAEDTRERMLDLFYWATGYRVRLAEPSRQVHLLRELITEYQAVRGAGASHLGVLRTRLASAQLSAGQTDEAIATFTSLLPEDGDMSFTLARTNLAHAYRVAERFAEAIEQLKITIHQRSLTMGPANPMVSRVETDLALTYLAAGETANALTLSLVTVENCERRLPRGHWITMQARLGLASCHEETEDFEAAIMVYDVILEDLQFMFDDTGEAASTRAEILERQATVHEKAGRPEQAISRREAAVISTDAPWALKARFNLALTYLRHHRPREAADLLRPLLADTERLLGPDHPNTASCREHLRTANRRKRLGWLRGIHLRRS